MRILHVVAYFPPDRVGGVGEVAAQLHRALLARGHDSTVLTAGTSRDDPTVERIATAPLSLVTRLSRYAAFAGKFDVVHCHQGETLAVLAAMRLQRVRTPVLATFHVGHRGMADAHRPYRLDGHRFGTGWSGWAYRNATARVHRGAERITLRLADAASFVSRSAALDVLGPERGATATVIHNAVPVADEATAEPKAAAESIDLLYVGSGGPRKRVLALPFVLEHVRRACPEARMRLVGVELERSPRLRDLFRQLRQDGAVVCEGIVRSSAAVRRFYAASKVLVVPSVYEGLPMVLLEALSCGLPCVATRVSGHPEVIDDGRNGFLVDPDAPRQMAERCVALLCDPDLRRRMGEAGRALVEERFGLSRQLDGYLRLYRRLSEAI